jgi:hypothetical protein
MTTTDGTAVPLPAAMLLRVLERRGAGNAPHMRYSLLDHLRAVHDVLVGWHGPGCLATAGLMHSYYGSDRLEYALGGAADRPVLRQLLGARIEALVWLYGACDFAFLRAAVERAGVPAYRDRQTGGTHDLPASVLLALCELMVANEVELATISPTYRQKKLGLLEGIAAGWQHLLSPAALAAVGYLLAGQPGRASSGEDSPSPSSSTARVAASE